MAVMWCMPSSFMRRSLPSRVPAGDASLVERARRTAIIGRVQDGELIPRFGRARRDQSLVVLEGFHALKHAVRFGANILEVLSSDPAELDRLADVLAPDLSGHVPSLARPGG